MDLTQDTSNQERTNTGNAVKPFERARLPVRSHAGPFYEQYTLVACPACHKQHPQGACELKIAGVEHCGLCGLAHFGIGRTCPHIRSETQVREMLLALKNSPEDKALIDAATKYLRGVKGHLVQAKKKEKEKTIAPSAGSGGVPTGNMGATNLERPPLYNPGQPQHAQAQYAQHAQPMQPVHSGFHSSNTAHPQHVSPYPAQPVPHAAAHANGTHQPGRWAQPPNAPSMDDHHVESALRGFLGQSG